MEQGTFDVHGTTDQTPVKLCECGCGKPAPIAEMTNVKRGYVKGEPRRFVAGHNFKKMAAERAARPAEALLAEPQLCACGCGEFTSIATRNATNLGYVKGQPMKFVRGHAARLKAPQLGPAPDPSELPPGTKLCECGCGHPAPIARQNNPERGHVKGQPVRFIKGHASGPKGPKLSLRKLFIEAGQKIGKSVVLDPDVPYWETNQQRNVRAARLRCECGTEYVRRIALIFKTPDSASCRGCSRWPDLAGQRFGRLTVVQRVGGGPGNGGAKGKWLCVCDCENEVTVVRSSLSDGNTQSCGCGRRGPQRGLVHGEAAFLAVLRGYQAGAKDRGLSWELSDDDFRRLTQLDCHYCGVAPFKVRKGHPTSGDFTWNGLDRIDSVRGYHLGNVVTACWPCNYSKRDQSYQEFMDWIFRLVSFYFFRPDLMPAKYLTGQA
jgi:hypothetical protein